MGAYEISEITFGRFLGWWLDGTFSLDLGIWLLGVVSIWIILVYIVKTAFWMKMSFRGSKRLHSTMIRKVLNSPASFFNENSISSILSRFSNDMVTVDEMLMSTFFDTTENFVTIRGAFLTIIYTNIFNLIPTIILIILYIYILKYFKMTMRKTKQFENIHRRNILQNIALTD